MKNALGRNTHPDSASRFLLRYERVRKSIEEEERVLALFDRGGLSRAPISDMQGVSEAHAKLVRYLAPSRNEISERLFFHYRLFERMTSMLSDAIRRIPEKSLRDYLIWHYFYQFTHEAIAEVMHYSVRQIYRQGAQARCALSKTLRLPPHAVPYKGKRFIKTQKQTSLPFSEKLAG